MSPSSSPSSSSDDTNNSDVDIDDDDAADNDGGDGDDRASTRTRASTNASVSARPPLQFTEKHRLLSLKLLPLRSVQKDIQNRLGLCDYPTPPTTTNADLSPSSPSSSSSPSPLSDSSDLNVNGANGHGHGHGHGNAKQRSHEMFVWSHVAWKSALRPSAATGAGSIGRRSSDSRNGTSSRRASEEAGTSEILASCREDVEALWKDDVVQEMLKRRRLRLDLMPGL